jgi:hypothetical protein
MILQFHPAAEQEVAAAVRVGETRSFGLGREWCRRFDVSLRCFATYRILASA